MNSRRFLRSISQCALAVAAVAVPGFVFGQSESVAPGTSMATAAPPVAPVRLVTNDYYGMKVVDPYRYIEIGRAHV